MKLFIDWLIMKLFKLKNLTANWDMIPQPISFFVKVNLKGVFEAKNRLSLCTQNWEGTSSPQEAKINKHASRCKGRQMLPNISVSLKRNAQCPEFPSHIIFFRNHRMLLSITAGSNRAVISHEESVCSNFTLLLFWKDQFKQEQCSSYQCILYRIL